MPHVLERGDLHARVCFPVHWSISLSLVTVAVAGGFNLFYFFTLLVLKSFDIGLLWCNMKLLWLCGCKCYLMDYFALA